MTRVSYIEMQSETVCTNMEFDAAKDKIISAIKNNFSEVTKQMSYSAIIIGESDPDNSLKKNMIFSLNFNNGCDPLLIETSSTSLISFIRQIKDNKNKSSLCELSGRTTLLYRGDHVRSIVAVSTTVSKFAAKILF